MVEGKTGTGKPGQIYFHGFPGGSAVIWFATNRLGTSVNIGSVLTEWIL